MEAGKSIKTALGDEAGRPVIDRELCTACLLCTRVCKSFTLLERDGDPFVDTGGPLGCIACGQCMAACAAGAVTVTGRDLTPDDRLPLPYEIAISTSGIFRVGAEMDPAAARRLAYVNGMSILYSAARETVLLLTGRFPACVLYTSDAADE